MNDKLLTDAELAAIARRKAIAECGGYLVKQLGVDIESLLADDLRCREWLRWFVGFADRQSRCDAAFASKVNEVRAALEGK